MPPAARSNRPGFWRSAPVKAPRSWPNSSLSIRPSGRAPQLTRTNGPAGAVRVAVQGGGDQLLAGAALADDQDGGVGRRGQADRLEDLAHRGALADQLGLGVGRFLGRLVRRSAAPGPQRLDLGGEGPLPQGPLQGQEHLVEVERLGQVVVGPAAHRLDRRGRAAEGGHDDHGQVGQGRAELGQHRQAVAAGHLQVEQHGVGRVLARSGARASSPSAASRAR